MLRHKEPYVLYRKLLGFYPTDIHLYEQACLRRSSSICEQGRRINNERLEFLGDAILDAIVADILFHKFKTSKEGFLTNTRAKIVKRESLNEIAVKLGLDNFITYSMRTSSHNNYMFSHSLALFSAAMFILGVVSGITMSIGTFLVTQMYEGRQRGSRLLFTDSFFSMAGMIFPMIAAFLLARSIEWYWVYACIGLVYVAIFILTFGCEFPALGKHAPKTDAPVEKEKWGIGVLFLSVAALCYILGQLGFISWVPEYAKGLGMSLNDAGTLVSNFWMSYMVGMWAFSFILRFFDLQRILTVLAGLAAILMYVFNTGTPAHMAWSILALGFFSSAIYTTIITLGSQQTKVPSPKLVNFVLTCGTIGTMLTFVVTGPIVEHSGPQAALLTANGLYAVVFVMCFLLGFVSRHRQHNTLTSH